MEASTSKAPRHPDFSVEEKMGGLPLEGSEEDVEVCEGREKYVLG